MVDILLKGHWRLGHSVTILNRGRQHADLPGDVEHLIGDRDGQLQGLRGRSCDAVVDTCGYVPKIIQASAALLADHGERGGFRLYGID